MPRAAAEQSYGYDPQIAETAAAAHVAAVDLRKLLRRRHVDRSQLGRAGNARPDRKDVAGAARGDDLGLVGQAGPWPHQTHVAAQHVEQLRQLVELERT